MKQTLNPKLIAMMAASALVAAIRKRRVIMIAIVAGSGPRLQSLVWRSFVRGKSEHERACGT